MYTVAAQVHSAEMAWGNRFFPSICFKMCSDDAGNLWITQQNIIKLLLLFVWIEYATTWCTLPGELRTHTHAHMLTHTVVIVNRTNAHKTCACLLLALAAGCQCKFVVFVFDDKQTQRTTRDSLVRFVPLAFSMYIFPFSDRLTVLAVSQSNEIHFQFHFCCYAIGSMICLTSAVSLHRSYSAFGGGGDGDSAQLLMQAIARKIVFLVAFLRHNHSFQLVFDFFVFIFGRIGLLGFVLAHSRVMKIYARIRDDRAIHTCTALHCCICVRLSRTFLIRLYYPKPII